ncbi:MAG: MFS transporter [Nitrososphaeria archaeon]
MLAALTIPFLSSSMVVYSIIFKVFYLAALVGAQASFVSAAMSFSFYGGALGGLVLGGLADRYGRRRMIFVSALIYSFSIFLVLAVRGLADLYMLWALVGFGVNAENGITYVQIVELMRSMRGALGGFVQGLYFLGMFVDSLLSYYIESPEIYFLAIGGFGVLSSFLLLLLPETRASLGQAEGGKRLFSAKLIIGSLVSFSAFFYTITLVTFAPIFAGSRSTIYYSFVGFSSFIIFGYLSDRISRTDVSIALQTAGLLAAALALFKALGMQIIFLVLYVATAYFAYLGVWLGELFDSRIRATAVNVCLLVGRLIGGAGPAIVAFAGSGDLLAAYFTALLAAALVGLTASVLFKALSGRR